MYLHTARRGVGGDGGTGEISDGEMGPGGPCGYGGGGTPGPLPPVPVSALMCTSGNQGKDVYRYGVEMSAGMWSP